jgi:hypothetical protein
MKVTLGYREFLPDDVVREDAYGTIEQTADGLQLSGDVETLQLILQRAQGDLAGVRQVRLAGRTGPFSDSAILRYLLKTSSGLTGWFTIEDAATRGVFEALVAAYMVWDRAWCQTIHTTGLRSITLLYGLPGDSEYLNAYQQRYRETMTPEQQMAFEQYVAAFHRWEQVDQ